VNDAADRAAIRDVLARYMRAMRLGDVDLMDDVFTADAIIDYTAIGGTRASWSETKPWLRGMIDVELFRLYVGDVYPTAMRPTWRARGTACSSPRPGSPR
jgi:hypothetical protein